MSRMRSHSRASSRGSDFYDVAVTFHQDDGSFADRSEEDDVMEEPRRVRCHSLSRLDSLQKKCRVQFEDPFSESKQVADLNVEQLLTQLQEHRATLDTVSLELFKTVYSTGIYFLGIDVEVVRALFIGTCLSVSSLCRTAAVLLPACLKFRPLRKVFRRFLRAGRRSSCQVCGFVVFDCSVPNIFCACTIPDYYRGLSFVISECTRRANISSHDLSMMMAVEGIQPRNLLSGRPRMSRHSSLLHFATVNAAYTSASGAHASASPQDVLLLLRNKCYIRVLADIKSIRADPSLPVTPVRSSPAVVRSSPSSKTPQTRASEPPGSRILTRRASDSSAIKVMDKGDKGSDNEGFSFRKLWKTARKNMVPLVLCSMPQSTCSHASDTG